MKPVKWDRVKELFWAALERDPGQRSAFLRAACGSDDSLRAEVESLLAAHERDDSFIMSLLLRVSPEASPEVPRGKRVGAYEVIREISHGGTATVYLARDARHDRHVALKVLGPELAAALGPERFLREIRLTAQLQHPHILPLHDSGEADGLLYYVMPYVEGESLRSRLNREPQLPLDEALGIAREVADALTYAHNHDVIHRDIKPENILLSSGHALVADFGIARAMTAAGGKRLTDTGIVVGTPAYMSPEQATGTEQLDGRSDIYSLACVLYEMLVGEPPFTGPTVQAVIAKRFSGDIPSVRRLRPAVPEAAERALLKALAPLPADRFATAAQFAGALGAGAGVPRAARRFARLTVPLALGAVLVAVAGTVLLRQANRAPALSAQCPDGSPPPCRVQPGRSAAPPPNSVAVLYFNNLSLDTNDAYLADGLTEDIITRLGRLPQLEVASRYLVRRHRQGPADPAQLGDTLGVAHLLSGTVRHLGRTLRVTAELISTRAARRLWGDEYDRPDTNLLAIQSEIAGAVARAIGGRLAPTQQASLRERPTRDPGAYDHYLKGNFLLAERNPRALARAVNEYSATVRADPRFSGALARVAYTYAVCLTWGWSCDVQRGDVPRDTVLARGLAAADRALRLDPRSSDAWMARGYLLTNGETAAPREALAAFGRAVGLDSTNAEAWHQYGATLELFGRGSAAVVAYRRALALDPDRPITWFDLGWLYLNRREFHTAIRLFDSALVVDPAAGYVYGQRGRARLFAGDTTGALRDLEESPHAGDKAWSRVYPVLRLATLRDTLGLGRSVADLPQDTTGWQMEEVLVLVLAGQRERAIQTLLRVAQPGGRTLWWLAAPELDPIGHDARVRHLYEESRRLTGPLEGPRR